MTPHRNAIGTVLWGVDFLDLLTDFYCVIKWLQHLRSNILECSLLLRYVRPMAGDFEEVSVAIFCCLH